jgi:putative ABC transport system ATP-binding protein
VRALARVSLVVARGEFISVTGPSGSGKSTLLHIMGGLDRADGGEVWVDGQRLAGLDDDAVTLLRRRRIGFVFQFFNLLPTLTAAENVALPLLLDGVPRREAERRAERMLDRVGLLLRRRHRPHELSGGEMQRVAIARALVIEPSVLLADEPTGNLDSRTGGEVLTLLTEAVADFGQTIVMVTHDARAAACSSRVVQLRDGAIADDTGGVAVPFPAPT